MTVRDLTGDGGPEVAVYEQNDGAGWWPSHIDIFALRGRRLVKLTGASSNQGMRLEDLNGDGRYEFWTGREIGLDECHAGQPRWMDLYSYKPGRGFVLANSDFPGEFRHWEGELRKILQEFPHDAEVWRYLGLAREIVGRRRAALAAYRSAAVQYRLRLHREPSPELRGALQEVDARILDLRPGQRWIRRARW